MSNSHLVQILLPKEKENGAQVEGSWFEAFLKELTDKFGGATSFSRAPAEGLWQDGGRTEHDNIAVVEVMADALDRNIGASCASGLSRSSIRKRSSSARRKSSRCEAARSAAPESRPCEHRAHTQKVHMCDAELVRPFRKFPTPRRCKAAGLSSAWTLCAALTRRS